VRTKNPLTKGRGEIGKREKLPTTTAKRDRRSREGIGPLRVWKRNRSDIPPQNKRKRGKQFAEKKRLNPPIEEKKGTRKRDKRYEGHA